LIDAGKAAEKAVSTVFSGIGMKRQMLFIAVLSSLLLALSIASGQAQQADLPSGAPSVIVQGSGNVSAGGQAAARNGDTTDAAQPIAQGSPDVFINGRPAVTMGDATACGGVIVGGASNIFINGKPMARGGDLTTGCPQK
jgi:uncharacterized Zn-binding protein involved in type VI secretion